MRDFLKRSLRRAKLCYLWITRILLAPNRFNVPFFTRLRFAIFGGFVSDQVALYSLDRKRKKDYLSEFDWYRSRSINEPFDAMLNNKLVAAEVLQHLIRVPRTLFVKNKGRLFSYEHPESLASQAEVLQVLQRERSLFMKPIDSGRGQGVVRFDAHDDAFFIDRKEVTGAEIERVLAASDGWFLSEAVEQHCTLAQIFPFSTNTIRMITARNAETGIVDVLFAVLRIGTTASIPVDNGSRGGLVSKIDIETGKLSEARTLWSHGVHEVHPDSGESIAGVVLPAWPSVVEQILGAADELPYLQFVAWDILVTKDGPVVIEANTSSGVNIIQIWGPQRNSELGDFYRAHGVIT